METFNVVCISALKQLKKIIILATRINDNIFMSILPDAILSPNTCECIRIYPVHLFYSSSVVTHGEMAAMFI